MRTYQITYAKSGKIVALLVPAENMREALKTAETTQKLVAGDVLGGKHKRGAFHYSLN